MKQDLELIGWVVLAFIAWAVLVIGTLRVMGVKTRAELQSGLDPYGESDTGLYVHEWNDRTRRYDWRRTDGETQ